jgi:hypothetical protein
MFESEYNEIAAKHPTIEIIKNEEESEEETDE